MTYINAHISVFMNYSVILCQIFLYMCKKIKILKKLYVTNIK